jgi:hypothetical protein
VVKFTRYGPRNRPRLELALVTPAEKAGEQVPNHQLKSHEIAIDSAEDCKNESHISPKESPLNQDQPPNALHRVTTDSVLPEIQAKESEIPPISHSLEGADLNAVTPDRVATTTYRILRDTELARRIKALHRHKCQICGIRIAIRGGYYAEAHHIQPLGAPHDGPDVPGNILCVCPNHHAMLDLGAIALELCKLRVVDWHRVEQHYADYHNNKIFAG